MAEKKFNILNLEINGIRREFQSIHTRNPKEMCEGFKTAYGLISEVGDWEAFFYAESSMGKKENANDKIPTGNNPH